MKNLANSEIVTILRTNLTDYLDTCADIYHYKADDETDDSYSHRQDKILAFAAAYDQAIVEALEKLNEVDKAKEAHEQWRHWALEMTGLSK